MPASWGRTVTVSSRCASKKFQPFLQKLVQATFPVLFQLFADRFSHRHLEQFHELLAIGVAQAVLLLGDCRQDPAHARTEFLMGGSDLQAHLGQALRIGVLSDPALEPFHFLHGLGQDLLGLLPGLGPHPGHEFGLCLLGPQGHPALAAQPL
jgi:hypothetical protein